VAPPAFTDPPTSPGGRITDATIESRASRRAWRAAVYTPPGHCTGDRLPVAVVLDLRAGQMSRVLDWLIVHRAIPPITAVFVGPVERGLDHPDAAAMRAFLTDELPRWMAAHHASNWQAGDRAIVAISFHAKDALDAALGCGADLSGLRATGCRHDPFNRLGLLIPGRRIARDDIAAIAARRRNRLRVAILAGRYDYANIGTARGVRDALAQAGHGVEYVEVPEGHSAVTWTHHLGRLLVGLYGPAT
jgi:hypothetical protein